MKAFVTQYAAMRFALDRQHRRRRGEHGFLASILLAFGHLFIALLLLPIAFIQLLNRAHRDVRAAQADPHYRGTFVNGRRPPRTEEDDASEG